MTEDSSIEQVQESIHEHAHHATERWISFAALTAAFLAALAAVGGTLAGNNLTESNREQIHSNDEWGLYQAKSIKSSILKSKMETLAALGKGESALDKEKLEEYDRDMPETKIKAEHAQALSDKHLKLHETFEMGVTLFHISIAIVAVAVLSKKPLFWWGSMASGAVGIVFLVRGWIASH